MSISHIQTGQVMIMKRNNIRGITHFEIRQKVTINSIRSLGEKIVPGCNCYKCKAKVAMKDWYEEIAEAFGFEWSHIYDIGKHGLINNRKGKI